jgi:hypothetical protein
MGRFAEEWNPHVSCCVGEDAGRRNQLIISSSNDFFNSIWHLVLCWFRISIHLADIGFHVLQFGVAHVFRKDNNFVFM